MSKTFEALNLITGIDWKLLRKQKHMLIHLPNSNEREGLLNLLDNLQDFAVKHLGKNENDVFDLSTEQGE